MHKGCSMFQWPFEAAYYLFLLLKFQLQCHNKMALECGIDDCNARVMTEYLLEYGILNVTVVLDLSIDF